MAVRIPQSVADEIGLDQDSIVELTLVDERLMIAPITQQPEETLESLLAQVTEDNVHQEVDMGPPVGKEIW